MNSERLNALYASYLADNSGNEYELLTAIRQIAAHRFRDEYGRKDEDAVQDFVLNVWQQLPELVVERSFAAWLQHRLEWRVKSNYRNTRARNRREQQPPVMFDAEGEPRG